MRILFAIEAVDLRKGLMGWVTEVSDHTGPTFRLKLIPLARLPVRFRTESAAALSLRS